MKEGGREGESEREERGGREKEVVSKRVCRGEGRIEGNEKILQLDW